MAAKIHDSVDQLIGGTPLLELKRIEKSEGLGARLLIKLESMNPGGSVKDRVARSMLDAAEKNGALAPGGVIIEPTSGNTGIGLATVAAARGYRLIVTMPENMSRERQALMRALGAEIVLTPRAEGMKGAIARAERLHKEIPGSILAGQFVNPANPAAHRNGTGPEIYADTDGGVDIFVAGVGTGGTITGVGEYLKSVKPSVRVLAVEPADSPVLSGGKPGPHKIQGIGAGFVPEVLNRGVIDAIVQVSFDEARRAARLLAAREGVLAGISSGASLWAAMQAAASKENAGKMIVALLPDTGERYLSTDLFTEEQ